MDPANRSDPGLTDEVWGGVATFLGDVPAAILALAVLVKRHR